MTTDKELADAIGVVLDNCRGVISRDMLSKAKDELDPPKPEYPDGTVAWVTVSGENLDGSKFGSRSLCIREDGEWVCGLSGPNEHYIVNVEPLRVLADDEIAIPRKALRSNDGSDATAELIRSWSFWNQWTRRVASAIADALDAESGDTK